ncbi:MAG: hypothetical protein JSV52_02490 [Candidatus Zixiibacteriota bacterium]|nr:MAG: hypothetical protein JSV52_02490 [candidate division Zixibacteria bacterium]
MTEAQEERTKDSQDSQTITIEIPANIFEAMYRIMRRRDDSGTVASNCCEMPRDVCCPEPGRDDKQDFVFTIRRKE